MSAKKKTKLQHQVSVSRNNNVVSSAQYNFTSLTTAGIPIYGQPSVNSNIIIQSLILNSRQLAEYYTNPYNTTTMDLSNKYLNHYPSPTPYAQTSPYTQAIPSWVNPVEQTISPTYVSRPTLSEDPFIETPWVVRRMLDDFTKAIYILNQDVNDFVDYISPRHEERRMRQYVVRLIEKEFEADKISTVAFGSFNTELYLPTSDIDLVFFCKSTDVKKLVHTYAAKIRKVDKLVTSSKEVITVANAKVPIVKFTEKHTGFNVDISFNQGSGIQTANITKSLLNRYPGSREL
ncbi:5748_t:CDS:2, partial [Ambispora leptoticha]